jgi:hypothetical protein
LQQKHLNVTKYWSLTSIVQIIAICIILFITLWVYVYFTNYFIHSEFILDCLPVSFNVNSSLILNANIFHKAYFEFFYTLYVLVVSIILVITWRVEYTFNYKLNFLITVSATIFFATLLSIFLKCGVIFWQKHLHNKTSILVFLPTSQKF